MGLISESTVVIGLIEVRIDFYSLIVVRDGLVEVALGLIGESAVAIGFGKTRIYFYGLVKIRDSLREISFIMVTVRDKE